MNRRNFVSAISGFLGCSWIKLPWRKREFKKETAKPPKMSYGPVFSIEYNGTTIPVTKCKRVSLGYDLTWSDPETGKDKTGTLKEQKW